jgi:hypothetical protein
MDNHYDKRWAVSARPTSSTQMLFETFSTKETAQRRAKVLVFDAENYREVAVWNLTHVANLTPSLEEI